MSLHFLAALQQGAQPIWVVRLVTFLQANALGVFMILLSVVTAAFVTQWVLWAFGLGRFTTDRVSTSSHSLRFVFADALVKIIDDFRHLLALILVGMFAGAILWALVVSGTNADEITKSLQAVVSTLGGLVGSIIGYYFGEARARRGLSDDGPGVPEEGEQTVPGATDDYGSAAGPVTASARSGIRVARPAPIGDATDGAEDPDASNDG
ncbi:MAG TPA: hypothetical protein VJ997_12080 [Longimicrobiales bacterium]|nr:hypothetical protein [Longimicrobiales bacterium]